MGIPFAREALLLLKGDEVLGLSQEATQLLGISAERVPAAGLQDLLDPWPGMPGAGSAEHLWRARIRGTAEWVRCRLVVLRGSEPTTAILRLIPEKDVERLEQDGSLLQALFSQAKVGLAVHDADLHVTRVSLNHHFQAPGDGAMIEPSGGQPLTETLVAEDAHAIRELLRQVMEAGEELVEQPQRARRRDQPLVDRIVSLSAIPLAGPDGGTCGVVAAFTDITVEYREREGRLLAGEAARRIGSDLDPVTCAQELVEVLVPAFANAAAVDLAEAVLLGEEPGVDPEKPKGRRIARRGSADHLAATPVAGGRATMEWELRARGQLLGRLVVGRSTERGVFDSLDETVAREIVSRTALSIDNARRYVAERRAAEVLRRSLLPSSTKRISAADTAVLRSDARAADADAGAWVDTIPLSSARVAFAAGRTSGRGVHAAAAAGRLRTAIQTLSDLDIAPDELLTHVDDLVRRLPSPTEAGEVDPQMLEGPGEVGATCLYVTYDPVTGHCSMASAGHRPPALISPSGELVPVPLEPGPPLGRESAPFETVDFLVEPGSLLILSAGGSGAPSAPLPSDERITGDPETAGALRKVLDGRPVTSVAADGVALAARLRVLPEGSTVHWQFPADPSVVAKVRRAVTSSLETWGLQDLTFVTELVASELVTNSIRYAGGPVGLRLINDSALICEVSDPSQTKPRLKHARLTDEGGRGLYLVHQLTEQWGSRYTASGKTIWTVQVTGDGTD
ncbi:SpoIIE family protein phosphatase [Streptomyces sp. NBC_00691]|uniref:SpoIIE family protein phosphatase n=1 Tax=Streptomyces sp. NBC_00691 TaxID=2903671 RepID=UPI002E379150|nr:SpoIIE family protein phosphatase [Streptomyces sp. NBC_00691]